MNFIIDEEIELTTSTENTEGTDLLNTTVYANSLAKIITTAPKDKTFTIGLFGEWGSGKSSILKTVTKQLESDERYKFIKYDAWKYAGDSFRRMFLFELQQQLGVEKTEKLERFYDNINEDAEVRHKANFQYIYFVLAALAVLTLLFIFGEEVKAEWKLGLTTFITMMTLLVTIKKHSTDDLKVTVQKSRLFAPEQFEECFNDIIEASRKIPVSTRISEWIRRVKHQYENIVIVIDNIDRCHHDMAYSLLTDIKNFLGTKPVTFIIPVDVKALKKHVLNTSKFKEDDDLNKDADEFLRKFFNVSLSIKPFHTDEMYEYASKLNIDYNLGFKPTTISLVSNEFATNPRRLIQLFNNLTIELQTYDSYFADEHQTLICMLLILREEFPDHYNKVNRNSSLLFNQDIDNKNERLTLFLSRTFYISKPYEFRLNVIDRILSNSKTSSSLTAQVREQIEIPSSTEEIKAFIDNNEDRRKDVVNYLLHAIRKAVDRNLFAADLINLYTSFLYKYEAGIIKAEDDLSLINLINKPVIWEQLLPNIEDNLKLHLKYASHLTRFSTEQPLDSYLDFVEKKDEKAPYSPEILDSIYYACSVVDANYLNDRYSKLFAKAYTQDPLTVFSYRYPEATLFFTKDLIGSVIDKMGADNISAKDSPFKQFLNICDQIDPQKNNPEVIKSLTKLHTVIPSFDYNSNNKGAILPYLNYLVELFSVCRHFSLDDAELLRKSTSRLTSNTQTNRGLRGMLRDNLDDEGLMSLFFKLFVVVSLRTNKEVIPHSEIEYLITNATWREHTVNTLFDLFKAGYDVSHYHEALLSVTEYSEHYLQMLTYMMSEQCPEERRMIDNEIMVEIKTMINYTLNKGTYEDLSDYLISITTNDRVKQLLYSVIEGLSMTDLEALPAKLQAFAVARFESNIENYTSNIKILKLIAGYGSKTGIGKLARIINQKLSTPGSESEAWEIIPKLHYLKQSDCRLLSTTIECLELESLTEEDKKGYIEQLKAKVKN